MRLFSFHLFFVCASLASVCLSASAETALLQYKTSWVGNTFGFSEGTWAQLDVQAIAVAADGTVYTDALWDEAGAEVSAYKNGKVVSVAGNTHGWGNAGGDAVAINDKYLYAAVSITNEHGKLTVPFIWPPKGKVWFGVTRRLRSDITKGASFEGGTGNIGKVVSRSFLLINEAPDDSTDFVTGLAASSDKLYVSNYPRDEVEVYDAETMKLLNRWSVQKPKKLALDPTDGSVFISSFGPGAPKIKHFTSAGSSLSDGPELPAGVDPSDVHVDRYGTIYIADSGIAQQVLIFKKQTGAYRQVESLGTHLGVLAPPKGAVGPLRFDGLTGVGTDASGNVYVSMNGLGLRHHSQEKFPLLGSTIESYGANQQRNWSVEADVFVSGSQVDPESPEQMLTATKQFSFDYDLPDSKNWKYTSTLVDRFNQPSGALQPVLAARAIPFLRRLAGHRFLFTLDQRGRALGIYRFDAGNGNIPVISGLLLSRNFWGIEKATTGTGGGIWRDIDGNGQFSPTEWQSEKSASAQSSAGDATSWSVDDHGNIWIGRSQNGLRKFPLQGFDDKGNPIYSYGSISDIPNPEPFNWVQKVSYDAESDSMYIAGYTSARPYDKAHWGEAGAVLAKYAEWGKGNRKPVFVVNLPWNVSRKPFDTTASFAVEKDYIFAIGVTDGVVSVYSAKSGAFVGKIKPGPEVGNYSGWVDVSDGVRAYRRSNGEYVITAEEDTRGKFIVYRWRPSGSLSQ